MIQNVSCQQNNIGQAHVSVGSTSADTRSLDPQPGQQRRRNELAALPLRTDQGARLQVSTIRTDSSSSVQMPMLRPSAPGAYFLQIDLAEAV
jgi:hypothetical protein